MKRPTDEQIRKSKEITVKLSILLFIVGNIVLLNEAASGH